MKLLLRENLFQIRHSAFSQGIIPEIMVINCNTLIIYVLLLSE